MVHTKDKYPQNWLRVVLDLRKLYTKCAVVQTSQNNLSFSLCAMLFVCCVVTTLGVEWSLRGISTNISVLPKNTSDRVQLK